MATSKVAYLVKPKIVDGVEGEQMRGKRVVILDPGSIFCAML